MRVRFIVLLAAFFIVTYVGYSQLAAQNLVTCPGLVQKAISSIGTNCGGLNRNSACYGFTDVQASFSVPQPANYFSQPSDRAGLADLQDLNTSPMDQTKNKWGIALMSMQANLPDTLPGQNVVFMLLGDTQVENAVPADQLAQPGKTVTVTLQIAGDLYYQPDFSAKKVGSVPQGTALTADAVSSDGQWVRVAYGGVPGWLTKQVISTSGDLTTLSVVTPDTKTPVQAFYFRTGISGTDCNEAPNALVVQGPKNLTVDIQANGADIRLGSTIALYLLPVDGMTQQYLTDHFGNIGAVSQLMQVIVLDGHVIINPGLPNETDLVTGQTSFTCLSNPQNLGDDGQANDRSVFNGCGWAPPRQVTIADIEQFRYLKGLVLNYPIDLPLDLPPLTPTPTFTPSDTFTPRPTRTPTPTGTLIAPTDTPTNTDTPAPQPTHRHTNPPTATPCDPFTFPATIATGDVTSLIAAIKAANDEVCHPGSQTINLSGGSYGFSNFDNTTNGANVALPVITSPIVINGNGSSFNIQGEFTARYFDVASGGNLALNGIDMLDGNAVGANGGAIYNAGSLSLTHITLGSSNADNGGGLYNAGTVSTTDTTFDSDTGTLAGGGLYNVGSANLVQTTFSNNQSSGGNGGGIDNAGGSITMLNSTIGDNSAIDGAGIYSSAALTLNFTTIAYNEGMGAGVAIAGGSAVARSTIIAQNGTNCSGAMTSSASPSATHNFSDDGSCGGFFNPGNLQLGPLQNNGGPTSTIALGFGSSAADDNDCLSTTGAVVSRDQIGTTRPQDLSTDVGMSCDAGSYEISS